MAALAPDLVIKRDVREAAQQSPTSRHHHICRRPRVAAIWRPSGAHRAVAVVVRLPAEDARGADGVPQMSDVLEHREVEIDVVVRREERQVRRAHAGRVEVCLERRRGAGGRDQRGCGRGRGRGRGGRRGQQGIVAEDDIWDRREHRRPAPTRRTRCRHRNRRRGRCHRRHGCGGEHHRRGRRVRAPDEIARDLELAHGAARAEDEARALEHVGEEDAHVVLLNGERERADGRGEKGAGEGGSRRGCCCC